MFRSVLAAGAAVLALSLSAWADESQTKPTDTAEIRSKASEASEDPCFGACRVNFRKELGVNLEYLDFLGQQIHQARKSPDPVGLALAAQSLAVAEKVSGNKASVTSDKIMEDAVQLAVDRGFSEELTALATIVANNDIRKKLEKQAEIAQAQEEEERAKVASGEISKELFGTLQVVNHTSHCLRVYMDGRYMGTVHSGRTANFHAHSHNWHNHFDAYCEEDGELIRHGDYEGHSHFLVWHIDE
jgi:hypothetical protein